MHYFHNQITYLGEKLRQRQARTNRLRQLHNLLLLSDADLADLDISRTEVKSNLLRLHFGAASASRR